MPSFPSPSPWLARHARWLVAVAALLCTGFYLLLTYPHLGFPLDDAWIHQVYARSLAHTGRWEYVPGISSAGSTAPLWTLWLALGYLCGLPFRWWAYASGAACLVWLGQSGMALWRILWPDRAAQAWLAGLVLVSTWPLVWAAASGMETLLFAALGVTLCAQSLRLPSRLTVFGTGFMGGLLVLTRPEGVILLLLIILLNLQSASGLAALLRRLGLLLFASTLPLLPYFAFNYYTNGHLWPNTFYAKQAEYAALLAVPLPARTVQLLYFSLGGPPQGWQGISAAHWLLLPGLILALWDAARSDWQQKRLHTLLPLLWAGGHVFLYAWRLPVTFQHGRYLLSALPIWVLFGLAGWLNLLRQPGLAAWRWGGLRPGWLASRAAAAVLAVLLLFFLLLGGQQYRADVAFVEGEMVTVARWLQTNTPPQALIAAHDIGAIGYFAQRPLLDLAGLISPEMTPLLHDESLVAAYVAQSQADYLVTAPGWPYAAATGNAHIAVLMFQTDYAWTRQQGLNNMAVYRLHSSGSGLFQLVGILVARGQPARPMPGGIPVLLP